MLNAYFFDRSPTLVVRNYKALTLLAGYLIFEIIIYKIDISLKISIFTQF